MISYSEALRPFQGASGAEFERWAGERKAWIDASNDPEARHGLEDLVMLEALRSICDLRPAHAERIARAALACYVDDRTRWFA